MSAEWVLAISTIILAVATILVFIAAVFQDRIHARITYPKLIVSIRTTPPDCHKIKMVGTFIPERTSPPLRPRRQPFDSDAYYLRLRTENDGNEKAEAVEVLADTLTRQQADGEFASVETFLPMNLLWSNYEEPYMPAISPGTYKLCNLGHIIDPENRERFGDSEIDSWEGISQEQTILSLDTAVKPYTKSHLIPPGKYRMGIVVAAANTKPVRKMLEITLTGNWYEDEREMLNQGIGITMID